jgi:hypothetical protein
MSVKVSREQAITRAMGSVGVLFGCACLVLGLIDVATGQRSGAWGAVILGGIFLILGLWQIRRPGWRGHR